MSRSARTFRVKFPSHKNQRLIHCESLLEKDAVTHFELSPLVLSYREQPRRIYYQDGNQTRFYTPDFELVLPDYSRTLIETKLSKELECADLQNKLACIKKTLSSSDEQLVVLTEQDLRQEPRLNNLNVLSKAPPLNSFTPRQIKQAIELFETHSLENFIQAKSLLGMELTFTLLAQGILRFQLNQLLTDTTFIHLDKENTDAWFYITKKYAF